MEKRAHDEADLATANRRRRRCIVISEAANRESAEQPPGQRAANKSGRAANPLSISFFHLRSSTSSFHFVRQACKPAEQTRLVDLRRVR